MLGIVLLSVFAGLATCLGALAVLALGRATERSLALFLGLAVGIMFGVVIFDLLPSAFWYGDLSTATTGFGLGVLLLYLLDRGLSLSTRHLPVGRDKLYLVNMGYLIAIGIALHDLPEGIAIAAGYSATQELGLLIALAIGIHNIPEGMAMAAPLKMGGTSSARIILVIALVSIFTPVGTLLGFILVGFSPGAISLLLALAGGAMAYIIRFNLLPESHRRHPRFARAGIVVGFVVILLLSIAH
ncbi:MAG: ZIP family metal transporter [Bacillota bacterium]